MLVGEPGTAKSLLSELLAAAISGRSTAVIQGSAGIIEDHLRYGWNYAMLLAEGPSASAMVASPVLTAMQAGHLVRIEEITRCAPEVQDVLISLMSEKTMTVPELGTDYELRAKPGFNVIATANLRDRGVHDMSSALKRRFNFETVLPIADAAFEKALVAQQLSERMEEHATAAAPADDVLDLLVTVFRDLRRGKLEDGTAVAAPKAVMSTAESVNMAEQALFGSNVFFAPIRHHSPACAWMLRAMIREVKPEAILIEGPSDLAHHIPFLADLDTVPPVAIAAMGPQRDDGPRGVSYYPISSHAPEFIAIQDGTQMGAELRFIDMAVGQRLSSEPETLQSEMPFSTADFVGETCKALGLRDGAELWDHLFETRLGQQGWRGFFADVYAYCLALRETTAPVVMANDGTLMREGEMRRHIAALNGKRAIVITGGLHTPALLEPVQDASDSDATSKTVPIESYLVAYGEDALDALSGYGAGLRYPRWYAQAWDAALAAAGPLDWGDFALQRKTRKLDIRRKPAHQKVQQFFYQMSLLETGLASLEAGPDFLLGSRVDLLFAEWSVGWSPFVEGALNKSAPLGATVPQAATAALMRRRSCCACKRSQPRKTRFLIRMRLIFWLSPALRLIVWSI